MDINSCVDDDVGSNGATVYRMKSLSAHADLSRGICVEKCCVYLYELAQITDAIYKLIKIIETSSECRADLRIFNRLELGKNISANIVGRFVALINTIKVGRTNQDPDTSINTLCNLANGVVELRNIVKEVVDDISPICRSAADILERLVLNIDRIGLKTVILTLAFLYTIDDISINLSGKIASSLASLMFAALLSIHNNNVRDALKECFAPRTITIQILENNVNI